MSMELLLYTCVNMVVLDAQLLDKCFIFFRNRSCTCSLAWKLHRYDIGSDGSAVRKIDGVVGRIDYHIVVSVPHDIGFMHYDLGHVYNANDWKQNTYHPRGPLPYLHALALWWFPAMALLYRRCALHLLRLGLHFPGLKASIVFYSGISCYLFMLLTT